MILRGNILEDKDFRKEHISIVTFSEMDSLVTKFECKDEKILAYGSAVNEKGITEISFYKEVAILGVVVTLKIYLQANGDKVYYHSCSILDISSVIDVFSKDEYAEFVWLKESLLEQVNSYISYEVKYENHTTKDIEIILKDSLLEMTDFKVCDDEPCKY